MSRKERGDTIVEVLLAILVVSVMLVGAFAVTNRSTRAVRASQERSQASKQVESQLELLRSLLLTDNPAPDPFTLSGGFCISPATFQALAYAPTNCRFNQSGQLDNTGDVGYVIHITRPNTATDPNLFRIEATWDAVTGDSTASTVMYYKAYRR